MGCKTPTLDVYLETFSEYFRRQRADATSDYQTNLVDVDWSKTEYMVRIASGEYGDAELWEEILEPWAIL